MKKLIVILGVFISTVINAQNIYNTGGGKVSFFSESPLENIDATTNSAICILNIDKGEIASVITIKSFHFEKSLMEEHFNEKYLESDKYPKATFKGTIAEKLTVDADTSYVVTVKGTIDIHGVEQPQEYKATYSVKGGNPSLEGTFNVALKDHKIEIPKLVVQNIAEVVKVTCKFDLKKYVKK
jgi:hypothetical protein